MNKRQVLTAGLIMVGGYSLTGSKASSKVVDGDNHIADSGVTFSWHHKQGRLHGRLAAPTDGWIAVGFNDRSDLRDTRFVIAAVSREPIRVEEHIALVPDHRPVTALGLEPGLDTVSGAFEAGVSHLSFSLPQRFADWPSLKLDPGSKVTLMLAWSRELDFDHHSAWRHHTNVTL